jgi:peptidoglycan hydrolase-like protein with peptidoglycan-binding domain
MDRLGQAKSPTAVRKAPPAPQGRGQAPAARPARPSAPRDTVRASAPQGRPNAAPINFAQNFGPQKPLNLGEGGRLRKGDEGGNVTQLQEMLNARGAKLAVDGEFGPDTERALRSFQKKNKIRRDGVVGPKTLEKLNGSSPSSPVPAAQPGAPAKPAAATPAPAAPSGPKPGQPASAKPGPAQPSAGTATPVKTATPPAAGRPSNFKGALDQAAQGQRTDLGGLKTLQEARQSGRDLYFKAGAAIDVDGSGPSHGDPYKQYQTSLSLKGGGYPNADKVPYFVLPPQVAKQYGAKVGDLGLIRRGDQVIPAVFADVGPRKKIGELSRYAAQQLGIPASPISGGTNKGVEYLVFPGSRGPNRPSAADLTPEALQARVQQLLAQRQ